MDIVTSGDIAQQLNEDRDAVNYALRKSSVKPVGRAGLVRMFPGSAVQTVKEFLANKRQKGAFHARANV